MLAEQSVTGSIGIYGKENHKEIKRAKRDSLRKLSEGLGHR